MSCPSPSFRRKKAGAHIAEVKFVKKPVRSHPKFSQPKFSKADHVKTKKGQSPAQKGAPPVSTADQEIIGIMNAPTLLRAGPCSWNLIKMLQKPI